MKHKQPSRIAFGSCNEQDRENKLWNIIESRNPAAFVWGGDSIYADTEHPAELFTWPPRGPWKECATPERVRQLYQRQRQVPGYQKLVEQNITIFGTIDDHDYGCDNADKNFPFKAETTQAFIEFIDEPMDSPLSQRVAGGSGVYGVKLFDFDRAAGHQLVPDDEACIDPHVLCSATSENKLSDKTVAVFVLDVRSNKDPWKGAMESLLRKDYEGDLLGEDQWQWFESAISASRASVNVIVNGLQVNGDILPNPNWAESWNGFPRSQQRLYDTILQESVSSPILVSGDVHLTQLMRKDCRRQEDKDQWRPIIEMTTSGMTHSWGGLPSPFIGEDSKPSIWQRLEGFFSSSIMHSMHHARNWSHLLASNTHKGVEHDGGMEGSKQGLQYSLERNFGELEFDWGNRTVSIRSIGEDGKPLLSSRVSMSQLSGKRPMSTSAISNGDIESHISSRHPLHHGDWVCLGSRGSVNAFRKLSFPLMIDLTSVLLFAVASLSLLSRWRHQHGLKRRNETKSALTSITLPKSSSSVSCGC